MYMVTILNADIFISLTYVLPVQRKVNQQCYILMMRKALRVEKTKIGLQAHSLVGVI